VVVPVQLDRESQLGAIEIHDAAAHAVLSPELETEETAIPEDAPRRLLGPGRATAQTARDLRRASHVSSLQARDPTGTPNRLDTPSNLRPTVPLSA